MRKTLIRAKYQVRKANTREVERFLLEATQEAVRGAAADFVHTAASNFPTLTGQAKAAVVALATRLGLDPGITANDPPYSDNFHLLEIMIAHGNTQERGARMSSSRFRKNKKSSSVSLNLFITSAHNDFPYFTWWDDQYWHSIEAAQESARLFVDATMQNARAELSRILLFSKGTSK